MFKSEFQALRGTSEQHDLNLYPTPLRTEIDANKAIRYLHVSIGVYHTGFAKSQEVYNVIVANL